MASAAASSSAILFTDMFAVTNVDKGEQERARSSKVQAVEADLSSAPVTTIDGKKFDRGKSYSAAVDSAAVAISRPKAAAGELADLTTPDSLASRGQVQ